MLLRRLFGSPVGLKSRHDVNRTETYLMIDSEARKRRSHSTTRMTKWFQPTDNDDDATSSIGFLPLPPEEASDKSGRFRLFRKRGSLVFALTGGLLDTTRRDVLSPTH